MDTTTTTAETIFPNYWTMDQVEALEEMKAHVEVKAEVEAIAQFGESQAEAEKQLIVEVEAEAEAEKQLVVQVEAQVEAEVEAVDEERLKNERKAEFVEFKQAATIIYVKPAWYVAQMTQLDALRNHHAALNKYETDELEKEYLWKKSELAHRIHQRKEKLKEKSQELRNLKTNYIEHGTKPATVFNDDDFC